MLCDNRQRARLARLALLLLMLNIGSVALASLFGPLLPGWNGAENGNQPLITEVVFILYGLLGFSYYAVLSGTCLTFLLWLHRAYYKLHQSPTIRPCYAVGWAVGAWFVPFLNLVRPYLIMREVWRGTQRVAPGQVAPAATVLPWWWAAFLLQVVIGHIAGQTGSAFTDQPVGQDVPLATIFDASAQLLAAALTWYSIGRCARVEEQSLTWHLLNQLGQPVHEMLPASSTQAAYWPAEEY